MTYDRLCYAFKVSSKPLPDIVKDSLEQQQQQISDLDHLISYRNHLQLELDVLNSKIARVQKLDSLYKKEYGI